MDRKELRKRWIMGTIQPELFYIPWKKKKRNEHYVFIWAYYCSLSKNYPTIQDYKQQYPNSSEYEFGFVIYDDKGNKVSDFSFGVSLPTGKYYAIQYCSTNSDSPRKISFPHSKIPFEIKDTDDDIYLYVDVSSRIYYLNVKFKPELCEQTAARFQITQIVEGENDNGIPFYEERPACVPELERAYYTTDDDGVLGSVIGKLGISSANDRVDSWLDDYIVQEAYDKVLYTFHGNVNTTHKNTLSEYPKIRLSKTIEKKTSTKYKVYFDVIEKNNWYTCIDYTYNYIQICGYGRYAQNSSAEDIYGKQYLAADKSWFMQNGFFVNEFGGLNYYKDNNQVYGNLYYLTISNGSDTGFTDTSIFLPYTQRPASVGFPVSQYINLDYDQWLYNTSSTTYWLRNTSYAASNEFSNKPENQISFKGDLWDGEHLFEFLDVPYNEDRTSFVYYGNMQHDVKIQLTNDEILDVYNSENYITPENGVDLVEKNPLSWFYNVISNLLSYSNAGLPYRPFISSEEMSASGYNINPGSYVSLYNDWTILPEWYFESYEIKMRYIVVHYTPIRHDGIVLPEEQMKAYLNIICAQNKENVQNDTYRYSTLKYEDNRGGYNEITYQYVYMYQLIIDLDTDIDITSEEYEDYCSGVFSNNIKTIINKENQRKEQLTNLQNKFNELYLETYPNVNISTENRYYFMKYFDLF